MSITFFNNIKDAIAHLNPQETRDLADQPVRLVLVADDDVSYRQMENYFTPVHLSTDKRSEVANVVYRASTAAAANSVSTGHTIQVYSRGSSKPPEAFVFHPENPEHTVNDILKAFPNLAIPLARHIYPFRAPVVESFIKKISKENALFSLATAIPDMIPFLSLPWAVGEFASDTAVLTANQVRLAFMVAAASDRDIGYREQKSELASILLGAFGWRAIARELVGKIPFGGGLLPKAAIAYAGTRVAGMSLERYYRIGYGFTREERQAAYADALERGKSIAGAMIHGVKNRQIAL